MVWVNRRRLLDENEKGLDRLLDQSRTQAAGAHANTFVGAADDCAHRLEVRIEHTSGLIVGVTDVIPGRRFLMTEFTLECHGSTPSD